MVSRIQFAGYMFGGGKVGTGRVQINLTHLLHKNMSEKHQALHLPHETDGYRDERDRELDRNKFQETGCLREINLIEIKSLELSAPKISLIEISLCNRDEFA